MRPGFAKRAVAAAIGALLALWFLRGDTEAQDGFVSNIAAIEEESLSYQGLRTFEIRFADGTAVTVMGSKAVPVIQYLGLHPKLVLELRPRELQRIER